MQQFNEDDFERQEIVNLRKRRQVQALGQGLVLGLVLGPMLGQGLVLGLVLVLVLGLGLGLGLELLVGLVLGSVLGPMLVQVLGSMLGPMLGLVRVLGLVLVLGLGLVLVLLLVRVLGQMLLLGRTQQQSSVEIRRQSHIKGWLAKILPEEWRGELEALRYRWLAKKKRHKVLVNFITGICLLGMLKAYLQIKVENVWLLKKRARLQKLAVKTKKKRHG
jgi:hypothetical protein